MNIDTAEQALATAGSTPSKADAVDQPFVPAEAGELIAAISRNNDELSAILRRIMPAFEIAGALEGHAIEGFGQSVFDDAVYELIAYAARTPYFDLEDYMRRSWVAPPEAGRRYAARLHQVLRSDHDRALHDHPWHNASLILSGGFWEVVPGIFQMACDRLHGGHRCSGDKQFDSFKDMTRWVMRAVELNALIRADGAPGLNSEDVEDLRNMGVLWRGPGAFIQRQAHALHRLIVPKGQSAWSLFITEPKFREWGFLTADQGWVHNEPYVKALGRDA